MRSGRKIHKQLGALWRAGLVCLSHGILGPLAAHRRRPVDILIGDLDIARFAMDATTSEKAASVKGTTSTLATTDSQGEERLTSAH